jgi:hypothetical protein
MSTPFLDDVYQRVDFDRELVFKFFTIFSLFEYALKRTKFRNGSEQSVEANWDLFAREIHDTFDPSATIDLQEAVDYLLNHPTKKQILRGNRLVFIESGIVNHRTIWLATLINRTRNNLFHGGKFPYIRERNPELIRHSLVILEAWAHCHPDVERELRNVQ